MTVEPRTIRPEWSLVVDRLLLVTLHVTRWRAATRTEFDEFGLDHAAFQAYTAGARRLLPQRLHDELQTLERMARDLQERFSYKTLFGYLMPKARYEEFKAWLEEKPAAELRQYLHSKNHTPDSWKTASLKARWFALAEEIASQRNALVDEMVNTYRPSAIVRWRISNHLPKDSPVDPPDEWLDEVLMEMVHRIPNADEIRRLFTLDVIPAFVEAPDEAVKAVKLEDIQRDQEEVTRRLNELDHIYIDAEREKKRLELAAERERLHREQRITEEVIAHEKQLRQERIDNTLNEVAGQLHQLVYGAVVDGLQMVREKDQVHPRWVGRVKNLVEQVRLLNFTDDTELARVCDELEQLADGAASKANTARVREALVDVGISLKADLVAANVRSRSARDLGIPDNPMPDLVRRARREQRDALFSGGEQTSAPSLERAARTLEAAVTV